MRRLGFGLDINGTLEALRKAWRRVQNGGAGGGGLMFVAVGGMSVGEGLVLVEVSWEGD